MEAGRMHLFSFAGSIASAVIIGICTLAGGVSVALLRDDEASRTKAVGPTIVNVAPAPAPTPAPSPAPKSKKRVPVFPRYELVGSERPAMAQVGGITSPDGTEVVMVDIQPALRMKNVGGKDGAGLCVFTSIMHDARVQGVVCLYDLQQRMRAYPGGGYPSKVDKFIKQFCPELANRFINTEEPGLDFLFAALESGRPCGVTYDGTLDPHYRARIAHMVSLVSLSKKWACILDNNFIGDRELVWMSPETFAWMFTNGHTRKGWACLLLAPGQVPYPKNKAAP